MMPWGRLAKVLVHGPMRSRLGILDESIVHLRVWPTDLDQNGHVNNGRYLSLMDLGRFDLITRTGMFPILTRKKWAPVVRASTITFYKSLRPFETYQLHTRLACWGEKWMFLEQRFVRDGETVAHGVVKAIFLGRDGRVTPQEILDALDMKADSPPVPDAIRLWDESLAAQAAAVRAA